MSLYKFFKHELLLPSPNGPLSKWVPPSTIKAVNDSVSAVFSTATGSSMLDGRKRGPYSKRLLGTVKASIANYAVSHRTAAVIRHFKDEFPNLKWSTVNDWKTAITDDMKKAHGEGNFEPITTLEGRRPSILSDKLSKQFRMYIHTLRVGTGGVNTQVVIVAATGMLQKRDPALLESIGELKKAGLNISSVK